MLVVFSAVVVLIAFCAVALRLFGLVRHLNTRVGSQSSMPAVNRYRPMLRLLSDDDSSFVANKTAAKKLRTGRIRIFREYMRCLTKDYGRLLAGIRVAMLHSETDRLDLARALSSNRNHFILALCRIEFRLCMYEFGFGPVDVSGLVEAVDSLRSQVSFMVPGAVGVR